MAFSPTLVHGPRERAMFFWDWQIASKVLGECVTRQVLSFILTHVRFGESEFAHKLFSSTFCVFSPGHMNHFQYCIKDRPGLDAELKLTLGWTIRFHGRSSMLRKSVCEILSLDSTLILIPS